jgi:hypothetical protein
LFTRRYAAGFYSLQDLEGRADSVEERHERAIAFGTQAIQDGVLEQFLMIAIANGNARTKKFAE